jgi:hypothetical protein
MRCFMAIFIFSFLAGSAQAQPSLANKTLTPESSTTTKLQTTGPEMGVKAATFMGDPTSRRKASSTVAKSVTQDDDEPGSWRMLAASVFFMVVIALRRQRSGRP